MQHMLPNNLRPTMLAGGADDAVVDLVNERSEWTTSLCTIRPKSRPDPPLEVVVQMKFATKSSRPTKRTG